MVDKGKVKTSQLRHVLSAELFERIYSQFMEQADKNAITKKAHGTRIPKAITFVDNDNTLDCGTFSQHFGQGSASKTPYVSWYVVSIYYIVEHAKIIVGIEEDRYPKVREMAPLRTKLIGNKKTKIAVFYEVDKNNIDYCVLREAFIDVSEKVMKLGVSM